MKRIICFALLILISLCGCTAVEPSNDYTQISQTEAWEMMNSQEAIILDVREADEYAAGHIPSAVLFPVGQIDEKTAGEILPERDAVILVYCRSGNRSKTASEKLVELGYSNVYEFGGINTWEYDVVTGK